MFNKLLYGRLWNVLERQLSFWSSQLSFLPLKGHLDTSRELAPLKNSLSPCPRCGVFHCCLSELSQQLVSKRAAVAGRQRLEKVLPATFDPQHSSLSVWFHILSFPPSHSEEKGSRKLSLWSSKALPFSHLPSPNPIKFESDPHLPVKFVVILQIPGLPYYHLTCD